MKLEKRGRYQPLEIHAHGLILAEQVTPLSFYAHEKKDQSVRLVFGHWEAPL